MNIKEKICGIYCIENLINGKKYIGQSVDIETRWYRHRHDLNNNTHTNIHLQASWNKYGEENFRFIIVEECKQEQLNVKEMEYVEKYNTYKEGYNRTIGGDNVTPHMGEITRKRWKSYTEKEREIVCSHQSDAQFSIPIYQIDLNTLERTYWENGARQASKKLNIKQSVIWNCVNHIRKTYKNCAWISEKEIDNFDINNYINQNTQSKRIKQYSTNGNLIKIWDSAHKIQVELGYDASSIIKVCKRKYKLYKGYAWCYEYDDYINEEYIQELHSKDYIEIYDLNDNLIDKLKTQIEVSKKYNINKNQVSKCLKGKLDHVKTYKLRYSN